MLKRQFFQLFNIVTSICLLLFPSLGINFIISLGVITSMVGNRNQTGYIRVRLLDVTLHSLLDTNILEKQIGSIFRVVCFLYMRHVRPKPICGMAVETEMVQLRV